MDKLLLHKLYCGTELKWTVLTCIDHVLCCIFSVLEGFLHLDGCIPADVLTPFISALVCFLHLVIYIPADVLAPIISVVLNTTCWLFVIFYNE
jgi:hypothetical protein